MSANVYSVPSIKPYRRDNHLRLTWIEFPVENFGNHLHFGVVKQIVFGCDLGLVWNELRERAVRRIFVNRRVKRNGISGGVEDFQDLFLCEFNGVRDFLCGRFTSEFRCEIGLCLLDSAGAPHRYSKAPGSSALVGQVRV